MMSTLRLLIFQQISPYSERTSQALSRQCSLFTSFTTTFVQALGLQGSSTRAPFEGLQVALPVNRQGEAHTVGVKETFLVGEMRTLAYLVKGIAARG